MVRVLSCSHFVVLAIVQCFVVNVALAQQSESKAVHRVQLQWHDSLDEATAESKRTGKPILMEIHGRPWCPPCVIQGKKIIENPKFVEWVHDKFVLLEIQVGEGYAKSKGSPIWAELFKKHRLPGIPAVVLLDSNLNAMGTVFPKANASEWLGAASNILTANALRKQHEVSTLEKVIVFRMTPANNISVPATLEGRIALNLMFHTAVDAVSLTKQTTARYPELDFTQQVKVSLGAEPLKYSTANRIWQLDRKLRKELPFLKTCIPDEIRTANLDRTNWSRASLKLISTNLRFDYSPPYPPKSPKISLVGKSSNCAVSQG